MSAAARQDEERGRLHEALEGFSRRARSAREALSAEQLARPPPEGGWSVGQVYEHLCLAHDSYLDPVSKLLTSAKPNPSKARVATWQPTVMGNFLVRSFRSPRRLPAPRIYRPGPEPRDQVIDAFLERQDRAVTLLEESADHLWQEIRMRSPVTALIRMNLGDAFTILVTHTERHFGQMDRIQGRSEFPR